MKLAGLWRLLAIGVALMAWLDPPVGVRTVPPVPIDVFVTEGDEAAARALITAVDRNRPTHVSMAAPQSARSDRPAPCTPVRPCVVMGEASDRVRLPADALGRVVLVTLPTVTSRGARVTQLTASPTHQLGAAQATVTVESRGLTGARGRITLTQAGLPAGSADITFTNAERIEATVPWVPSEASPAVLRASVEVLEADPPGRQSSAASGVEAEGTSPGPAGPSTDADAVSVLVPVRTTPWPVLVHEARPSWATTFVRRALEDDPRFAVSAATSVAPGLTVERGRASASRHPLSELALDDTHVAIVGAAEQLSASEVTRLERFVRQRGGALVLVPDREWSGPVTTLVPGRWPLVASAELRRIGPLSGREWLLAEQLGPGDVPVLSDGDRVGATVTAMGHGLLLVSGALDAWRFRGDATAWNQFWVRLLADVAGRTPDRLQVTLRSGDRAGRFALDVRRRSLVSSPTLEIAARQQCADDAPRPLRVWPGLHLDQFRVEVEAVARPCRVTVTAGADATSVMVPAVDAAPSLGAQTLVAWGPEVTRAGGTHVETGAMGLTEFMTSLPVPEAVDEVRYPMRSPLWMVVVLGSLGIEWWLRRRAGGR